jgi:hypothetical protein
MTEKTGKYRDSKEYDLVKLELIRAAQYRGTITYKKVASILGIHQAGSYMASEVGEVLGEISTDEVERSRPMLSALAVSEKGSPGPGFYTLAKKLNLFSDDDPIKMNKFWVDTQKKVYDTWKREY